MNKTLSTFVAGLLIGALAATAGFAFFLKSQKSVGSATSQTVLEVGHSLELEQ